MTHPVFSFYSLSIIFLCIYSNTSIYSTSFVALKADEAARKKKEKEALLAQEEAALGSGGKVKSSASQLKSKKKPPTNDLSLLNQHALVSEAEKKRRLTKKAELEKKQQQMEEAEAARRSKEGATTTMDPLLLNTQQMLEGAIGREGNVQMDTTMTQQIDGLDGALLSLNIGLPGGEIKRRKALYMAFESKMMPIVRDEHPGLRLSQYKEKIFALWKKSPDNPDNVN
jgi:Coiled-coil domain-containing protein 124 /Oxs1